MLLSVDILIGCLKIRQVFILKPDQCQKNYEYLARGRHALPHAEVADEVDDEQTQSHCPLDLTHLLYTLGQMQLQHPTPETMATCHPLYESTAHLSTYFYL